jgi:hypothetical protein
MRLMAIRCIGHGVVASAFAGILSLSCATAQESNNDQVGVVVPAFRSEDGMGLQVAYAMKAGVQRLLASEHPRSGEKRFGSAISYLTPKPMQEDSRASAVALAELNGLQATLWGVTHSLQDGIAVEPHLAIAPPYEDFRRGRPELWRVKVDDVLLELGAPQLAITLAPVTFSTELVEQYGRLEGIPHCPVAGGECIYFTDYSSIGRIYGFEGNRAILRRGGTDYYVELPSAELLASEAILYTALMLAYYRGNFYQVIDLSRAMTSDDMDVSVPARIDALLYRGAAHARLGEFADATEAFAAAAALNPIAERTFRFHLMGEIMRWQAGLTSTEAVLALWRDYRSYYAPADKLDAAFDRLANEAWQ